APRVGARPAAARRVSECVREALGSRHRSGLGALDAGADAAVPRRRLRVLRRRTADDRLRLAGVYRRRRLCADDGGDVRLRLGTWQRRSRRRARRHRAAVLETRRELLSLGRRDEPDLLPPWADTL